MRSQNGFALPSFLACIFSLAATVAAFTIPDGCVCEWKATWNGATWGSWTCGGVCATGCESWLGPSSGYWHCVCDGGGNICVCYGGAITVGESPPVIVGVECFKYSTADCSNHPTTKCAKVDNGSTWTGNPGIYTYCQCVQ
jgi:hypothetical protein